MFLESSMPSRWRKPMPMAIKRLMRNTKQRLAISAVPCPPALKAAATKCNKNQKFIFYGENKNEKYSEYNRVYHARDCVNRHHVDVIWLFTGCLCRRARRSSRQA